MAERREFKMLRILMQKGMDGRTQRETAEACGLSLEHFNRMLNHPYIAQPSKTTVEKLSKGLHGVKRGELYDACGYKDIAAVLTKPDTELTERQRRMKMAVSKRSRLLVDDLKRFLLSAKFGFFCQIPRTSEEAVQNALSEYFEMFHMLFSGEQVELLWKNDQKYNGKAHDFASRQIGGQLRMDLESYQIFVYFVVYYTVTDRCALYITDVALDGTSVLDAGILPEDSLEEFRKYNISVDKLQDVSIVHKKTPKEIQDEVAAKFLDTIFGETIQKLENVSCGFGFHTDGIPIQVVRAFIQVHSSAFLQTKSPEEVYQQVLNGSEKDILKAFENYRDDVTYCHGLMAAVANIIRRETGITFVYQRDETLDFRDNPDCIFYNGTEIPETKLVAALMPYARELGVEYLETCYFKTYVYIEENRIRVD